MSAQLFEIIRKRLGWNRYKMAKALKMSQTQYLYLEEIAQNCTAKSLVRLQALAERELEMSLSEFWDLVTRD